MSTTLSPIQAYLRKRLILQFFLVLSCSVAVLIAAILTPPSQASWIGKALGIDKAYAASGTILDYKIGNYSSVTLIPEGKNSNTEQAVAYYHRAGSGTYTVAAVVLRIRRPASGGSNTLVMRVTKDGSNPYSSTGTVLGSGSVLITSIPIAEQGADVQFVMNNSFQLEEGSKYFFELYSVGTNTQATQIVVNCTNTSGNWPWRIRNFIGNWINETTTRCMRLKMFGEEDVPVLADATLSVNTFAPYLTNQYLSFHIAYHDLDFVPSFVNFYSSSGATVYTQIPIFAQTNSGTLDVSYRYPYTGTYYPFIELTNFGTGSIFSNIYSSVTINSRFAPAASPLDSSNLWVDKTDILSGQSVHFTWSLIGDYCTGSSVSDIRLFRGYPSFQEELENDGIPLGVSLGSGSGDVIYTDNSVPYYPYIEVECANGTVSGRLYVGSSTSPVGINVLTEAQFESQEAANALGAKKFVGGGSATYWTATGATSPAGYAFWASDTGLARYQPVTLTWQWKGAIGFTVGSVYVYPDLTAYPTTVFRSTGSTVTSSDVDHHMTISYNAAGQYQPVVELRSTSYSAGNPATFTRFYLGGGLTSDSNYAIYVFNNIWNASSGGSGTGSVLCATRGIFGLEPSTFTLQISTSTNPLVTSAQELGGRTVSALLWLAGNVMCVIDNAPIISSMKEIIAPDEGIRYLPQTYDGRQFLKLTADTSYDLQYNNDADHVAVWQWLMVLVRFSVAIAILEMLLPKHRKL